MHKKINTSIFALNGINIINNLFCLILFKNWEVIEISSQKINDKIKAVNISPDIINKYSQNS